MRKGTPVDLEAVLEGVHFLANRRPESHWEDPEDFSAQVADYRNGGVFVAHFAGRGEWERHAHGDELVMVLEGEAEAWLIEDGEEHCAPMSAGQVIVIPQNTWHRFVTAGVKIMTVTPRPTDHSLERPD